MSYNDPNHEGNSAEYHTGAECINRGCANPAGTAWSPLWCFECNVKRIDMFGKKFDDMLAEFKKREHA